MATLLCDGWALGSGPSLGEALKVYGRHFSRRFGGKVYGKKCSRKLLAKSTRTIKNDFVDFLAFFSVNFASKSTEKAKFTDHKK